MYDQTKQELTKRSCSIYTMLNIIKYDFGIKVKDSYIFTLVYYFEKIGVLLPKGAYFSIIYPAMVKVIELKTGLNLKVKIGYISKGLDDVSMWGLGFKRLSSLSILLSKDGILDTTDMIKIAEGKKGSGHNLAVKLGNKSNKWTFLDSRGGKTYTTTLKALKRGVLLDIYYDKARTLIARGEKTTRVQKYCIAKVKKSGRLISWEEFKKFNLDKIGIR